jgi:hypothetical protein
MRPDRHGPCLKPPRPAEPAPIANSGRPPAPDRNPGPPAKKVIQVCIFMCRRLPMRCVPAKDRG